MKTPSIFALAIMASAVQAQSAQDIERFERHVETHDLSPRGGSCVVSFTLNGAGYIATINLSKCGTKDQANALTRLGAALPFPVSSTVSREVSIRL